MARLERHLVCLELMMCFERAERKRKQIEAVRQLHKEKASILMNGPRRQPGNKKLPNVVVFREDRMTKNQQYLPRWNGRSRDLTGFVKSQQDKQ